jgi:small conductance mechanosensitive channel
MLLKKLSRHLGFRAILLTGIICVIAVSATPVRSQSKTELKDAKVEEVQSAPPGDPKAAITTKQLDISIDELKILVKPLTLEELQNEAAGWMQLLKTKAKEISQAEVAIKRQNVTIAKQDEGAKALQEAKKALEEAEKIQGTATPGSQQYQDAAKKVEEAKADFKKAQEAVEEAKTAKQELKEDKALKGALDKAKETNDLDKAKQTLDDMKKDRENKVAGSVDYEQATKKIEKLEAAIKRFEDAKEVQKGAKPNSPEHQEAAQQIDKAQAEIKQLITEAGKETESGTAEQSSKELDKATANLETAKIVNNGDEKKVAGSPGAVNNQQNLQQKQQQLENTTQQLQKSSDAEADAKNQLVVTVTELRAQQTALTDRFNVILDELERKGGKVAFYRQYIQAIGSVELDTKDTQGLGLRLLGWVKSEEGGLRWANNAGKFLGVLVASIIVAQILGTLLNQLLSRFGGTSVLMRTFIVMMIKRGGVVIGFLLALTALEVSLGPVLALLGGVSFILAFALQSNLGNLASGLMIMAYKPFDVGDEVRISGIWGKVDSISLANTTIKALSGPTFIIPNNEVWGHTIENLSSSETRKIQIPLRINFERDVRQVEQLVINIFKSHPQMLENPAPSTLIAKIDENQIVVNANGWVKRQDFWRVYQEMIRRIQEQFNKEGINLNVPTAIELITPTSNGNGKVLPIFSENPVHQESVLVAEPYGDYLASGPHEDLADLADAEGAEAG